MSSHSVPSTTRCKAATPGCSRALVLAILCGATLLGLATGIVTGAVAWRQSCATSIEALGHSGRCRLAEAHVLCAWAKGAEEASSLAAAQRFLQEGCTPCNPASVSIAHSLCFGGRSDAGR